ncbi:unnamed protein product [Closterium sp. Yama58-4]|nr:unnamed protein product [Closterium sp. Yama58-4]
MAASLLPTQLEASSEMSGRELLSKTNAAGSTATPLSTSSDKSPPKSSPTKSPPAKSPPVKSPPKSSSPPKNSSPPKTSSPAPDKKKRGLIKRLIPKRKKKAEAGDSGPAMVNLADAQKVFTLVMSLSKQKQFVEFFQKAGLLATLLEATVKAGTNGATFLVPSPDALQSLPPASPYINNPLLARATLRYHMILGNKFDYTQLVEFAANRKFATLAKRPVFKSDESAFFTVVFRSGSGRSKSTMIAPNLANTTSFQLHLVDSLLIPDDVYRAPPADDGDDDGDDSASPPPPSPKSPPKSPPPTPPASPSLPPPVVSSPPPPTPVTTSPPPPAVTTSPPPPAATTSPPPPTASTSPPPPTTTVASPPPPV